MAIVGASCRMPGGANNAEEFWKFLRSGGNGTIEFPTSRFEWKQLYDATDVGARGRHT